MIDTDQHAPLQDTGAVAAPVTGIGDVLPRLRRVLDHRFVRSRVCAYMGRHGNILQRVNDPKWRPRLDLLEQIEHFLKRAENLPGFSLDGPGWVLTYHDSRAWHIRTESGPLGPFSDPDSALAAGTSWSREHSRTLETNLAERNRLGGEAATVVLDRPRIASRGHRDRQRRPVSPAKAETAAPAVNG